MASRIKTTPQSIDQLVLDIRQKINILESKTEDKDIKGAEKIRKELQNIRLKLHDPNFRKQINFNPDPDLTTYPEYGDPEFLKKIFYKKEFFKDRYMPIEIEKGYEKLAEEECSSIHFRLTPNQIFLKNFMSPYTPYNNLLIFHGVGVGKCHQKDTGIMCYDGSIKKVQDIRVGEDLMGEDSCPRRVTSLARGWDTMFRVYYDKCEFTINSEHILVLLFRPPCTSGNSFYSYLENDIIQVTRVYVKNHQLIYEQTSTQPLTKQEENIHFFRWISTKPYSSNNDIHNVLGILNGTSGFNDVVHIRVDEYVTLPEEIKNMLFVYRVPIFHFKDSYKTDYLDKAKKICVFKLGKFCEDILRISVCSDGEFNNRSTCVRYMKNFKKVNKYLSQPWIKYGEWCTRQRFMAGFLQHQITHQEKHIYPYVPDLVFIARSIGIYVDVLIDSYDHTKEPYDQKHYPNYFYMQRYVDTDKVKDNEGQVKNEREPYLAPHAKPMYMRLNLLKKFTSLGKPLPANSTTHYMEMFELFKMYRGQYHCDIEKAMFPLRVKKLLETQEYYGFTLNKDHRYLLDDFIVTHNTCSAITIAEQYHDVYDKKVLVLLPSRLKSNFKNEIFDVKAYEDDRIEKTCTGLKYVKQVPQYNRKSADVVGKAVNRKINQNYEMLGYQEFSNRIEEIEKKMKQRFPYEEERQVIEFKNRLKNLFSNRVIVMDEIHNARRDGIKPGAKQDKKTPKRIMQLLESVDNCKLIMLSATPMFNEAREIVHIMNYLLSNDKKPILNANEVFDENDRLKPQGAIKLARVAQNYVSYMRGQNPFSFPFIFYPDMNHDPSVLKSHQVPIRDINNQRIPESSRLRYLVGKLVISPLSATQQKIYDFLKPDYIDDNSANSLNSQIDIDFLDDLHEEDENDEDEDDEDDEENDRVNKSLSSNESKKTSQNENQVTSLTTTGSSQKQYSVVKLIQASSLSFPNPNCKKAFGNKGFKNCFDILDKNPRENRRHIQCQYKPAYVNFLHYDNLGEYSSKIKKIVDYILNSEGIVFVYSRVLYSSLLPLAIALEHFGFRKSDGTELLAGPKKLAKRPYSVKTDHGEFAPHYTIFSHEAIANMNKDKDMQILRSRENAYGEKIKVILGTSVSSEGLDMKNIREIHIIEPWYNLNRLNQVIGRANRKCSHKDLPIEKRNVTVYKHVSLHPKEAQKKIESVDLRVYRIAEQKQKTIDHIEKIMMENSIDCALNKYRLFYPRDELSMTIPQVVTSQGKIIKHYRIGDKEDSLKTRETRCAFNPYEASSDKNDDKIKTKIDKRTFRATFYKEDIEYYKQLVSALFKRADISIFFDIERLKQHLKQMFGSKLEDDVILFTLDDMIKNRERIINAYGEKGFIVYFSNKYMFQPEHSPYLFLTKYERKNYVTPQQGRVLFDARQIFDKNMEHKRRIPNNTFGKHKMGYADLGWMPASSKKISLFQTVVNQVNTNILQAYLLSALPSSVLSALPQVTYSINTQKKDRRNNQPFVQIADLIEVFIKQKEPGPSSNIVISQKDRQKTYALCLAALSLVIDRFKDLEIIVFMEEVVQHIDEDNPFIKKGSPYHNLTNNTNNNSPSHTQQRKKQAHEMLANPLNTKVKLTESAYEIVKPFLQPKTHNKQKDTKQKMLPFFTDVYHMALYVLLDHKYLVFIPYKNEEKRTDVYFRNPFFMHASLEFQDKDSKQGSKQAQKIESFEIEKSLMTYNRQKQHFEKNIMLNISAILNMPEMRNSFKEVGPIYMNQMEGFYSVDSKNSKQMTFKVIDKKPECGVKCGTGSLTQADMVNRINRHEQQLIDREVAYKKSQICLIYELAIRFIRYFEGRPVFVTAVERYYMKSRNFNLP